MCVFSASVALFDFSNLILFSFLFNLNVATTSMVSYELDFTVSLFFSHLLTVSCKRNKIITKTRNLPNSDTGITELSVMF